MKLLLSSIGSRGDVQPLLALALGIRYVYAAYCPATLPSPDYPPATMGMRHQQSLPAEENRRLWGADAQSFDEVFGLALNEQRAALGLPSVAHVASHITTDRPWLAADPVLAPAGTPIEMAIWQTGAWVLADPTQLTVSGLAEALRACLVPELAARAKALAGRMEVRGARIAAERLIGLRARL